MAAPLFAVGQTAHEHGAPPKLVQLVRAATEQFINVNDATAAGYAPFLGCIFARALALFVHGRLEGMHVDADARFARDLARELRWKAVGIVQQKDVAARQAAGVRLGGFDQAG